MKFVFALLACFSLNQNLSATTVMLKNGGKETTTTGDNLDQIRNDPKTVNVEETQGLSVTARTLTSEQELNSLINSFGVVSAISENNSRGHFEAGEAVEFVFDKPIILNAIDFNNFDQNEEFTLIIGDTENTITYEMLSNKTSDIFEGSFTVPANTPVILSVNMEGAKIGIDSLDITIEEEKPAE